MKANQYVIKVKKRRNNNIIFSLQVVARDKLRHWCSESDIIKADVFTLN
jgi:hypothetical protein